MNNLLSGIIIIFLLMAFLAASTIFSPNSVFGRRIRIKRLIKHGVESDKAKMVVYARDLARGYKLATDEQVEIDELVKKYGDLR